ncbi:PTS sugar transporter subunit IIA [Desulfoluna spongiiphila]|uniref:PTS system, mannose-specific IIA component n=1 Tax=Desulfoluna spongiiphila TaxID=419481 RepID=A0A1G5JCT6_9BACT|nr:PTS fructose transporter subunit IIA [Desulfoluna spongiiphila]SCY86067.1 PTS system, mannose-specific IIA component [Desulfoluna spongiiphila]VVS90832.1 phosphotransferase system mannose-type iia component [Desulfoluna spongiiphila]
MIGILVVTHGNLGDILIETAEFIQKEPLEQVKPVSINITKSVDDLHNKVAKAIKEVNSGDGVLILTDMFGGTPSNLSLSFLEEDQVEVISGVNLPLLISAVGRQKKGALASTAKLLENTGKRSISLASSILNGAKR